MKNKIFLLTLISSFNICCTVTLLNHKNYKFNLDNLIWNKKIEDQVGEIHLENSKIIYGRNWDSTFIVISPETGDYLDTLNPYTVEKERECLIVDKAAEFKSGYTLFNIPADKKKYSKVTLKVIDRQNRGDIETFHLIVNTINGEEITIIFNREQFNFIKDILYFKD